MHEFGLDGSGWGPIAALYGILDQIVDEYAPVIAGLENDIDEIEDQLFNGDRSVSRRVYELSTEVMTKGWL